MGGKHHYWPPPTKKSKLTASIKKDLYAILRNILIARDGEKCLRCGIKKVLHMSHIYPKGKHRRMEFDPDNLKFLCVGCHLFWWHKHPVEAMAWLEEVIPKDRLKRLKQRAYGVDKSPIDYKLLKLLLEQEYNKLIKK